MIWPLFISPWSGYLSFAKTVSVGLELGIKEITTYAFSIENFKRPKSELDGLWGLMEEKLQEMINEMDKFYEKNARIMIVGNYSLLPKKLQKLCFEVMENMSKIPNPILTCYFAIAYTSRDEMTTSMKEILSDVKSGILEVSDIDDQLVQKCFYTCKYPIDMVVRTSGETRLSDFLLWQSSDALLYFTSVLWPEFDHWEMLKSVMYYQFYHVKKGIEVPPPKIVDEEEKIKDDERRRRIEGFVKLNNDRKLDLFRSHVRIEVWWWSVKCVSKKSIENCKKNVSPK